MPQEIRIEMVLEIPESQSPDQVYQSFRAWAEANGWSYSGSIGPAGAPAPGSAPCRSEGRQN